MPASVARRTNTKFLRQPEWTGRHSTLAIFIVLYSPSSLPGLTRQSIGFIKTLLAKQMDARDRRQVYAVCASLTAFPRMTKSGQDGRSPLMVTRRPERVCG